MVDTYFEVSALAEQLAEKLNGTDGYNINYYGLNNIFPSETYRFHIVGDTGSFKQPERTGNTVTNYINGEYRVISNDVEGVDKNTSNAVVQMRVEFLVPLRGGDERNKQLLEAVRDLTNNELKYTEETESDGSSSMIYTHFTNYSILNTGTRAQRDIVGDSINLTIFVTHTFVALGVASSAISLEVAHPTKKDNGSTYFEKVAASKFGIARKTESDSNVYTKTKQQPTDEEEYPETKQQPTSTVLTITADLLTRLLALDYYVARYTYDGIVEPFVIRVTRPGITYDDDGNLSIKDTTKEYTVIINAAGINGELGTISSTSVTFTTAAPNLTEAEVET